MEVMEAIVHASDDEDGIDAQPHARLPQKSSQCPPAETQEFYEEPSMLRPQQEQGASMPLSQIESQATPPRHSQQQQQQQVFTSEMGATRYEQQQYPALHGRQMNHSQQLLLSPRQGLPRQQESRPTSQTMPTVYPPQEPPRFLDQQQYSTPPPHRMPMIYSPHGSPQLHQQYISAPHGMPMVYSQQRQPLSSMPNSQTHQPQALVNSQLQFQHSTRFHSEPTDQLSRQPQQSSVVAHQQLHSRPLACPSVDPVESELAECNEVQAVDQELSIAESLPPTPQNMFKMKKQHRPDVWHFMRLVRKDSCSDIPVDKLRSEHAGAASCKLVDYRVGATVPVRRHMELKHAEKLDEFNQMRAAAKRSAGGVMTLSRDGAICSMPSPETVVISAITPEQQAHANELLAVWIAKRLQPFSTVEDAEFIAYVTYLTEVLGGVRVKVPGRTRLREDIVLVASRLRAKLRNLIRRECRYFCVTTDIWTSMIADSYIALTLHYVTPDFRFRSWTLEVESFPGRHSGEAIAAGLSRLFEGWGLSSEYCVKLLRDGASNAVLAGELLNIEHMSCVAHSLHLVLAGVLVKRRRRRIGTTQSEQNLEQHHTTDLSPIPYQHFEHSSLAQRDANLVHDDSLEVSGTVGPADSTSFAALEGDIYEDVVEADMWLQERAWEELDDFLRTWVSLEDAFALDRLRDTVQKFRDIAVYVHKSPKAKNWFQKTQRERMGVHPLRVIIDCPTRWNSARNMLARRIELNESLALFYSFLKSSQDLVDFKDVKLTSPDPSDWFKVKCLISLLDPFAAVTEELSGGYPTLAMAVPFLRYIKRWLLRGDIFDETVALEGRHDYVDDTKGSWTTSCGG